jgi:hypothetical protein
MTTRRRWHLTGAPTGLARAVTFVLALLALCPSVARADIIQFAFQGTVTDNTGDLGVFGPFGTVNLGDVITGHLSYETGAANPDQDPGDPQLGVYDLLGFVIDQAAVAIAPEGIAVFHEPPSIVIDPMAPPDLGSDRFLAAGSFDIGGTMFLVRLELEAPYNAVFSDDSLPGALALSDFPLVQQVRAVRVIGLEGGGSQIDAAQLFEAEAVPEPAILLLLTLGAGAAGVRQWAATSRQRRTGWPRRLLAAPCRR